MLPFDFCEKCNQEHIGFHIKGEDISSEINQKYSSKKFADSVNKAKKFIEEYFPFLHKKEISKNINNKEKNTKAYENCVNINKDILQFYQILIDNYVKDNYVSNKNMKTIRFNAMKEIETIQEKSVIYAILLKDNRIAVTFSYKITIYDIENNFHCDISIDAEVDDDSSICQLDDESIVASSYCSLNIWSISKDKYNFLFTIPNANEAKINKLLALSKNRIVSCSFDEIKIFHFSQNKKPIQVIKENRKFLTESICYIRQKEILLFGGYKIALKLISMKTYQCITAIEGINCSWIN